MATHEDPSPRPTHAALPTREMLGYDRIEQARVARERRERTAAATRVTAELVESTAQRARAFRPAAPMPIGAGEVLQLLVARGCPAHAALLSHAITLHPDADELRETQAWALAVETLAAADRASR